jgi:hypothetical protein
MKLRHSNFVYYCYELIILSLPTVWRWDIQNADSVFM